MRADAASPTAGAPHWNPRLELTWTERELRCQLAEGVSSARAGAELDSSCLRAAWSGVTYTRGWVGRRGISSRPEDEAKYTIYVAG